MTSQEGNKQGGREKVGETCGKMGRRRGEAGRRREVNVFCKSPEKQVIRCRLSEQGWILEKRCKNKPFAGEHLKRKIHPQVPAVFTTIERRGGGNTCTGRRKVLHLCLRNPVPAAQGLHHLHALHPLVVARTHLPARLAPAQQLQAILSQCAIGIPIILVQLLPLHTRASLDIRRQVHRCRRGLQHMHSVPRPSTNLARLCPGSSLDGELVVLGLSPATSVLFFFKKKKSYVFVPSILPSSKFVGFIAWIGSSPICRTVAHLGARRISRRT